MEATRRGSRQGDDVSTNTGSSSAMMTSAESIDRGDRFLADVIGGRHRAGCLALCPFSAQPADDRGPAGGARHRRQR